MWDRLLRGVAVVIVTLLLLFILGGWFLASLFARHDDPEDPE